MVDEMPKGRPDPDPTILTTQQLMREIDAVRDLIKDQDTNQKQLLKDKVEARHTEQLALMDLLQAKLDALAALSDEKFKAVDLRMTTHEAQRLELKEDTEKQVQAALTAQKESVKDQAAATKEANNKSEVNVDKRLEEQGKTSAAAAKALEDKVSTLQTLVTTINASAQGGRQESDDSRLVRTDKRLDNSMRIALISTSSSVVGLIVGLFASGVFSK